MSRDSRRFLRLVDAQRGELERIFRDYGATNPRIIGSVARGAATAESDLDIVVDMDPADGNLLMRAAGLLEETRALFERDDIDIFPSQLLRGRVSRTALSDAIPL